MSNVSEIKKIFSNKFKGREIKEIATSKGKVFIYAPLKGVERDMDCTFVFEDGKVRGLNYPIELGESVKALTGVK